MLPRGGEGLLRVAQVQREVVGALGGGEGRREGEDRDAAQTPPEEKKQEDEAKKQEDEAKTQEDEAKKQGDEAKKQGDEAKKETRRSETARAARAD